MKANSSMIGAAKRSNFRRTNSIGIPSRVRDGDRDRKARPSHLRRERARHVFGYACLIDVTMRGKEERVMRKSYETFCPVGPWITTADEVGDPFGINMQLWVNGELRQHSTPAKMIVGIREAIAMSSAVTRSNPATSSRAVLWPASARSSRATKSRSRSTASAGCRCRSSRLTTRLLGNHTRDECAQACDPFRYDGFGSERVVEANRVAHAPFGENAPPGRIRCAPRATSVRAIRAIDARGQRDPHEHAASGLLQVVPAASTPRVPRASRRGACDTAAATTRRAR